MGRYLVGIVAVSAISHGCSDSGRFPKIFEKQGIPIIPVSVDYQTAYTLQWREFDLTEGAFLWNRLLHEYIGIVVYKLTGKI